MNFAEATSYSHCCGRKIGGQRPNVAVWHFWEKRGYVLGELKREIHRGLETYMYHLARR
ncbi:hypothetical protein [Ktedonosporobacter rubrisoli]|uniref:hypothetical protein n=1 Tax=Ktedonosporobacter rubrisoli TaxID=2509675 RepID=UPI0013EE77F0|nr:hypothetical protein [Ktedonosporobacter rubrisoli]